MTYFIIIIIEQDRGLEAISAALRRQQKVGLAIQDEVSEHNGKNLKKPKNKVTTHCIMQVLAIKDFSFIKPYHMYYFIIFSNN